MVYRMLANEIFLPLSDRVLGLSLSKDIKKWHKMQWYQSDILKSIQRERLRKLINHSIQNVPYYARIAKDVRFILKGDPFHALKNLPVLTKEIIKSHLPDDIVDKSRDVYFTSYTSGSSGIQGEFLMDKQAYSAAIGVQSFCHQWSGYRFGDRVIQTGMTLNRGFVKKVKDLLFRVKYTQAFQIDSDTVIENLKRLRGTRHHYFMGYASSLYMYAKLAMENGINDVKFKCVVSWGDKMFPHYRDLIEKQFNTTVYSDYGSAEGTTIAMQCREHNYHVLSPHVYIELLDDKGNEVNPGEIGNVIVTRLDNYLMPLIRYRIGDLAIKSDPGKRCPCGRHLPMLEEVIGRDTDIVYTPSGKALIVHFFTGIFEFYPEIKQFQVVQRPHHYLEIRYIPSSSYHAGILDRLEKDIYEKANEKFILKFNRVDEIFPSPSGKPQIIINED